MPGAPAEERGSDIRCDGCGQLTDVDHIRRRILRLELATRSRPIHISVLFVIPAPPLAVEDYLCYVDKGADVPAADTSSATSRSQAASDFFDDLLEGCGISTACANHDGKGTQTGTSVLSKEAVLGEFQHRGFFLADCIECPLREAMGMLPGGSEAQSIIDQFGPTLIKRIRCSYKPKHVILLSSDLQPLVARLDAAGLGDRLLHRGGAVPLASFEDESRLQFRQTLTELLAQGDSSRNCMK